jgi:hypothetical protein
MEQTMFNRFKQAWRVLRQKTIAPDKIYVYPSEWNPNKFVQLMYWRDNVLALDAEGKIWKINEDYSGFTHVSFLFDSPPRRY